MIIGSTTLQGFPVSYSTVVATSQDGTREYQGESGRGTSPGRYAFRGREGLGGWWRVPGEYAQCVASSCSSPDYKRFKAGEAVAVDVFTVDDTTFAESRESVT
jgi:hypothetical protein